MDKQKIFVVDDKDMIGKIIMACLGRDYDCRYFDKIGRASCRERV